MDQAKLRHFIANLPTGTSSVASEDDAVNTIDIDNLPAGIVTGSNLIQFPDHASAELKSSVALSLLAAQRVASNDPVTQTPEQWVERHNIVLRNLNWRLENGGAVKSQFDSVDAAVHQAIIPFLTAAFGGAVTGGALIVAALTQLQAMDKNSPWITLFDRQSRRFDVTEYQFSVVEIAGDSVNLKLASARFAAEFGQTQVLFFKIKRQQADFQQAHQTYSAHTALLTDMNAALKAKLMTLTRAFIRSLPDDLLRGIG